jgi:catechol 2,3-dioxygenase-like lactoylglutathione lyase family enzyme
MKAVFLHAGLTVADLDVSANWYSSVFELKEVKRFEKEELDIKGAVLSNDNLTVELLQPGNIRPAGYIPEHMPDTLAEALQQRGNNHFALTVLDLQSFTERLLSLSVPMYTELKENGIVFCVDPDGSLIEVKQG